MADPLTFLVGEHWRRSQEQSRAGNEQPQNPVERAAGNILGQRTGAEGDLFAMLQDRGGAAGVAGFHDAGTIHNLLEGIQQRQRERYGVAPTERGMRQENRSDALDLALARTQGVSDAGIEFQTQQQDLLSALLGIGNQQLNEGLQGSLFGERLGEQQRQRRFRKKLASRRRRSQWMNLAFGTGFGLFGDS